jgi:hypothetical protein
MQMSKSELILGVGSGGRWELNRSAEDQILVESVIDV